MRIMRITAAASFLAVIAFALCACNQRGNANVGTLDEIIRLRSEGESIMNKLVTSEELLRFINDHDTGVNKEDFDEIDIDDFIVSYMFSSPAEREDVRLYELRRYLNIYKKRASEGRFTQLRPLVRVSADSTDEEYLLFIDAYFKSLGWEYRSLGITKYNLDRYVVNPEFGKRYYLEIWKTKDIHKYDMRGVPFSLYLPGGEIFTEVAGFVYYSKDYKFFLSVEGEFDDYLYEAVKLFTETAAPSSRDE